LHPKDPAWGEFGEIYGSEDFDDDGGEVDGMQEDEEKDLPQMFADGLVLVLRKRVREQIRGGEAKKRRFKSLKRQGSLMGVSLTVPPPMGAKRPPLRQEKARVESGWGSEFREERM
jgi:hypothetical protein